MVGYKTMVTISAALFSLDYACVPMCLDKCANPYTCGFELGRVSLGISSVYARIFMYQGFRQVQANLLY